MLSVTQVLDAAQAPKTPRAYFLGPFARKVSFAAQQHRALNLVYALTLDPGFIRAGDRVAVIGAGLAGLTAAAGLIARNCRVTVFDRGEFLFPRQRLASHRFIHPTVNRWPFEREVNPTSALPFLDWCADNCDVLLKDVAARWKSEINDHVSAVHLRHRVDKIRPSVDGARAVHLDLSVITGTGKTEVATVAEPQTFNAVIVASGFEDDFEMPGVKGHHYWDRRDEVTAESRDPGVSYLVSGAGDGGLIDTLRLVHKDFDSGRLIVRAAETAPASVAEAIQTLEKDASKDEGVAAEQLFEGYLEIARDLPQGFRKALDATLALDLPAVRLLSRLEKPFSIYAAPIHKLLIARAIEMKAVIPEAGELQKADSHNPLRILNDGKAESLAGCEVIVRHGAGNTLKRILEDTDWQHLQRRQQVLSDYHDVPIWQKGWFVWNNGWHDDPTNSAYRDARLHRAAKVAVRYPGVHGVDLGEDDYRYRVHGADAANLPSTLFGVKTSVKQTSGKPGITLASIASMYGADDEMPVEICGGVLVGRNQGVVGALASDSQGQIFAIIASHLLAGVKTGELVQSDNGDTIVFASEVLVDPQPNGVPGPLARIPVDITQVLDCSSFSEVVSELEILGGQVSNAVTGARGRLTGARCTAELRDPSGETRRYTDLIEVMNLGGVTFAEQGQSGSPVLDAQGRLVGFVIGRQDDDTLVAPAASFFERLGLALGVEDSGADTDVPEEAYFDVGAYFDDVFAQTVGRLEAFAIADDGDILVEDLEFA